MEREGGKEGGKEGGRERERERENEREREKESSDCKQKLYGMHTVCHCVYMACIW